jgi:hypothetical protein
MGSGKCLEDEDAESVELILLVSALLYSNVDLYSFIKVSWERVYF